MDESLLVVYGGEVKRLGEGWIEGLAAPFGGPKDRDLEGEWFGTETDFGLDFPVKINLYYNHCQDPTLGKTRLARALVDRRDDGLHFKANLREELDWKKGEKEKAARYRPFVEELVGEGDLGASTGSARHVVVKDAGAILGWPLADLSLTPTPCHPRTLGRVQPFKSWEGPTLDALIATRLLGEVKASSLPLTEHSGRVVTALAGWVDRLEERANFREATETKSGRMFSAANLDLMRQAQSLLAQLIERAASKEEAPSPTPTPDVETAEGTGETPDALTAALQARDQRTREQLARYEAIVAGLAGVEL